MDEQETIAVTTDAEQPSSEQTRVERLVSRRIYFSDSFDLGIDDNQADW